MDNYMAIKYFLKNFPEYAKNDFYLTGESYGGIYIPTMALNVMQDSQINFKVIQIIVYVIILRWWFTIVFNVNNTNQHALLPWVGNIS